MLFLDSLDSVKYTPGTGYVMRLIEQEHMHMFCIEVIWRSGVCVCVLTTKKCRDRKQAPD